MPYYMIHPDYEDLQKAGIQMVQLREVYLAAYQACLDQHSGQQKQARERQDILLPSRKLIRSTRGSRT